MAIDSWFELGHRVTQAREQAGLSKAELSARAGLERTALSKIESGRRGLSALELARLARCLDLPLEWFVLESPVAVVSRRSERGAAGGMIDRELERAARDVELLVELRRLPSPQIRAPRAVRSHNQAELLAIEARNSLGAVDGPLLDLAPAAEALGLLTFAVEAGPKADDGAYVSVDGVGVAVVNASVPAGRRRFTLAHEIGHHLLADAYAVDLDIMGGRGGREGYINSFAAHLLMPRGPVTDRWHRLRQLADERHAAMTIAVEYRVSWSAALGHLVTLDLLPRTSAKRMAKSIPGKAERGRMGLFIVEELRSGWLPEVFQTAVLTACAQGDVGAQRAWEMLRGQVELVELKSLGAVRGGGDGP